MSIAYKNRIKKYDLKKKAGLAPRIEGFGTVILVGMDIR